MNYIVFDLEWNQNPSGKKTRNDRLPFEIIEIGAVKVNSKKEITDHFHRLIKPQVYKWIHDSIHEVIHVDYKDLMKGVPFEQAVREFIDWCGEDWYFFTWGNQDVMELQRNMKFYGLLDLLPGPVTYYDVQKLYSISYDDGTHRCALEHAIDELKIEKSRGFHRALADACLKATPIADSQLGEHLAEPGWHCHHDHFKDSNPNIEWKATLDQAEKVGLGTREYELKRIK